ncbi:type II toxin-antitoxin system RelE/ParE family toxin [Rhizobium binae]|uniref:type II toxin-antitoxin system RelE/ParE family toxin n=1 Tax=Rhizobium binae TaxID=1138190 RepID=UPI001C83A83A|nr:type II toxin-antitoxin system RelE/ParE family toxin [Rhizobium binae]MBX4969139.1 type II toxin-antitoxin system RelE/ParE family toxin [Rhizobium binae]
MPQVIFSPAAIRDLERLREFLRPKNPSVAKRAGESILKGVNLLGAHPHIGRFVEDLPEQYREWFIDFGESGYGARYGVDGDFLTILAVPHQKETGFQ